MTNLLVINLSTTRKPDLWLLSAETFTDEELLPMRKKMRKGKIKIMPEGGACRWGKLYSKAEILEFLSE